MTPPFPLIDELIHHVLCFFDFIAWFLDWFLGLDWHPTLKELENEGREKEVEENEDKERWNGGMNFAVV